MIVTNTSILIVEDESVIAMEMEDRLVSMGYTVAGIVASADAALNKVEEKRPDLVLMDIHIQGRRDGIDTAGEIRDRFQTPVVYVTAYADEATLKRARDTGPYGYIIKPVREQELRATIEMTLYKHDMEKRLYESEARNRALLNANPDLMFLLDHDGTFLDCHAPSVEALLIPPEQFLGKNVKDVLPPDIAIPFVGVIEKALVDDEMQTFEYQLMMDASTHIFEARVVKCTHETVLSLMRDITERKRAENALQESEEQLRKNNRLLSLLREVNQSLVRADDEMQLLDYVCRACLDAGGYKMVWVGYAEYDDAKSVRPLAQRGFNDGYLDQINITWADTERGRGPTGTAIRTGRPVIANNILTDPQFEPWRAAAIQRGYASSIALPIIIGGGVIGALNIYAIQPDAFSEDDVKLLMDLTGDLAYGIAALRTRVEHKQAEEQLRISETRYRAMVEDQVELVCRMSADGTMNYVNESYLRFFKKTLDEVIGSTLDDRDFRGQAATVRTSIAMLSLDRPIISFEEYQILPDGNKRWIQWVDHAIFDSKGNVIEIQAVGRDITERKLSEAALLRSEMQLSEAQSIARMGSWELDLASNQMQWSGELGNILGIRLDESGSYKTIFDRIHPDDRERVVRTTQQAIAARKPYEVEYRIIRPDGIERYILTRGRVILDGQGNPVKALGSSQDITERKYAEEELREKDYLLSESQRIGRIGAWSVDFLSNKMSWTEETYRLYDVSPESFELSVDNLLSLLHPEDRSAMSVWIASAIQGDAMKPLEYHVQLPDGETRILSGWGEVIYDNNHQPIRMVGTVQDITERKRGEQLLQGLNTASLSMQKAVTLDEVFEGVSGELKKIGLDCVILVTNENQDSLTARYITYKKDIVQKVEKLTGLKTSDFFVPIDAVDAFRLPVREKQTVFVDDMVEVLRQSLPGVLKVLAQPVVQALQIPKTINAPLFVEDKVFGIFSVQSNDLRESDVSAITAFANQVAAAWRQAQLFEQARQEIDARRQAEDEVRLLNEELEQRVVERTAQLQAVNKELEAFAYTVSHDLRAPLRAMDGYTRILVDDFGPILGEEGVRVSSIIHREANRMGELIDDLLDFSRISRTEMTHRVIDMSEMAHSVFDELMLANDRSRVEFRMGKLPAVEGDASLMRQVWVNLIGNAIKFSSKQKQAVIQIDADQKAQEVVYSVIDNGAGFDMQYANKLFGVFQRLHTEREFPGTGVGLAIVQRIVQRHGGKVWAESQTGKGATFRFTLPWKGS